MSLINKSKQYKTVIDDWKYILRSNDTNKTISRTAKDVLFSALYQIEKYGQAIFTHTSLESMTDVKRHQNLRLLKQLGYVFDWNFSRRLVINDKKYNDVYQITLKKNAEEILQNPKKYFDNFRKRSEQKCTEVPKKDRSKNALTSEQKCSEIGAKKLRSQESLHIYYKNKDKIKDNKENLSSNSVKKEAKSVEYKTANSECAEKSHSGLARENLLQTTQAKKQTSENIETDVSQKEEIYFANQKITSTGVESKNPAFRLLSNFPLTDYLLDSIISKSNKNYYQRDQVISLIRRLIERNPNKQIYGGEEVFVKYMIITLNNETEYLTKTKSSFSIAEIKKQNQQQLEREIARGGITWLD